jgi:hypothetical protein
MLRQVRLELARCHEFPEGSSDHGYELILPLTGDGHLDRESWQRHRQAAGFCRFWGGDLEQGRLRHGRRGWALAFAPDFAQSEVIFRGDEHRFAADEYVSITERDGVTRTFRVAAIH